MDWPTENLDTSNESLRPSTLSGGYSKKRKQLPPLSSIPSTNNSKSNKSTKPDLKQLSSSPINEYSQSDDDQNGDSDGNISHIAKKHRSVESSAKKHQSNAKIIQKLTKSVVKEKQILDPRFLEHTGDFDRSKHAKDYAFLNDLRQDEIRHLRHSSKKIKDFDTKEEIRRAIQSREEKIRHENRETKHEKLLLEYKSKQKELAKQGITSQYINESKLKKQLGAAQEFLSLSHSQIDQRIKRHQEKHTNRDKANFRKQSGNSSAQ